MKKLSGVAFVLLAMLVLSACKGSEPASTGTTAGSIPVAASSQAQPSSQVESFVHGTIEDATMNTIVMKTDDGLTLNFSTEDADKSSAQGLLIGCEINVYYTGKIEGEGADKMHVVHIESTENLESGAA